MIASIVALALVSTATAHMQVQFPPPLKSKFNPNAPSAEIDYNMIQPLDASGSDFPCKGYQTLLGTPAGASTASFAIGSQANVTITGASEGSSANHGGGSCQISLSTDGAKTFTVLQSIIGNCPTAGTSNLDFTIPADAPAGDHVLAWTWHNQIGNREMYMNCASVTLTSGGGAGGSGGVKKIARAAAYASRPGIFIANVGAAGGGCTTEEMFDVVYPEPGPDVVNDSSKPKAPTCGVTQQVGGGGSSVPSSSGGGDGGDGRIFSPESGAGAGTGSSSSASATIVAFTSSAQPATTLATSVKPPATTEAPATTQPASTTSPASSDAGNPSHAGSSSSSSSAASAENANTPGSTCTEEGGWACLSNGSSFQRCASGQWSVILQMAAGTACSGGTSDQMNIVALAA